MATAPRPPAAAPPLARAPDPARVAADLDRDGFVELAGAIDPAWLAHAQADVRDRLARHGEKYMSVVWPAREPGSAAARLVADPGLNALLDHLGRHARPNGADTGEPLLNVLRIVAGPHGGENALKFHYDASVVTALVPLFIPQGEPGRSGELVVYPNRRPYRPSVAVNLAEKALVQSDAYQRRFARRFYAGDRHQMRDLAPGNLYLFWGYRTFHANLPCAPGSLRATMLLHLGNPHGRDPLTRTVRALRERREARRIAAGA